MPAPTGSDLKPSAMMVAVMPTSKARKTGNVRARPHWMTRLSMLVRAATRCWRMVPPAGMDGMGGGGGVGDEEEVGQIRGKR